MEQLISNNTTKVYLKKAVCIVSGGLDSICAAAYVTRIKNFDIYMINFSYGQRATNESSVAKNFAIKLGAKDYRFVDIQLHEGFLQKDECVDRRNIRTAFELPTRYRGSHKKCHIHYNCYGLGLEYRCQNGMLWSTCGRSPLS